jgi:hypothetical protein
MLQGKGMQAPDGTSQDSDPPAGTVIPQPERQGLHLGGNHRHLSVSIFPLPIHGLLHNICRDDLSHGDGRRHISADRTRQYGTIFPYGSLLCSI